VWNTCSGGEASLSATSFGNVFLDGNYVYLSSVAGSHAVTATTAVCPS
jgi:hypothetical protein